MYAIIEDSGTQIKVSQGQVIKVAVRDMPEQAATITFDRILAVGGGDDEPKIGTPVLEGVKVTGDILGWERTKRVPVVKFKKRKGYLRRRSHRQSYIKVKVTSIDV